jgi:hypothetical protein
MVWSFSSSLATNFFISCCWFFHESAKSAKSVFWPTDNKVEMHYIYWISWYVISLVLLLNFKFTHGFLHWCFWFSARGITMSPWKCSLANWFTSKSPWERNEILMIFSSLFSIKSPWKQFLLCLVHTTIPFIKKLFNSLSQCSVWSLMIRQNQILKRSSK